MKIIHVFLDADLRNGHDGFDALLKKQDIDIADLDAGEAILFLNTAMNRAKVYSTQGYVGYVRFGHKMQLTNLHIFTDVAVPGKTTTLNRTATNVLRGAIGSVMNEKPAQAHA